MFDSAFRFIPLAFAALLPVRNPLGSALILVGIVGDEPPPTHRRLVWRIALKVAGSQKLAPLYLHANFRH